MTRLKRARVLIVDDSALMRKLLSDLLGSSPRIEVVGAARDGTEAIRMVGSLRPDVVTLDVAMPGMSGLEALPKLLDTHEAPVVMVSAYTRSGADITLAALELGAVDFMPKPDRHQAAELRACRDLLVAKVLTAARSHVHRTCNRTLPRRIPRPETTSGSAAADRCVVLGISTGGPQTLSQILPGLVPPLPPLLIVQHMPAQFVPVFTKRLGDRCRVDVREAADGDRILPDRILVAPGGRHMALVGRAGLARVALRDGPPISGHRPSIDVLFRSAATVFGRRTVGILMTGMGRDGVDGCKQILAVGGATYGQDEGTSIVYGMNKIARDEGVIQVQFPAEELPEILSGE